MLIMIIALLLMSGIASAYTFNVAKEDNKLSVIVNGVEVDSDYNHINKSKVYVSVEEFADLLGQDVRTR